VLIGSGFFLLAWIALWIAGFVDAITADSERIRVMPKAVWVILILLFSGFAAIAWFVFGRPKGTAPDGTANRQLGFGPSSARLSHPSAKRADEPTLGGWQLGGTGGRRRSGPVAPDDDPEFLRQLGNRRPPPPETKPDQPA
jgi:Phospholipase_D-nuclease N-terminal